MPQETPIDVGDLEEKAVSVKLTPEPSEEESLAPASEPAPEVEASSEPDDELEDYSTSVQNRISNLTKRFREEERQKQSAIQYAENVNKENEALKNRIGALDQGFQEQFDGRVSSELETAKRILKEAHETGDIDKLVDAQEALAKLSVQRTHLDAARAAPPRQQVAPQQPAAPEPAPPPQQAAPDPKAEAWASRNEWFGQDEVMTYGAFGIHRGLIEDEGLDPSSDEYYSELDKRLRTEFPNKFDSKTRSNGGRKVASAESSASRNRSGRKTVRLTPSQVAIAKRLNVPLEEYAKYVRD
jgi:hypothetical protein